MVSIVLADDNKVVRQELKVVLGTQADFSVVGEAGDGLEAVRLAEDFKPDILVADITMDGINGLEVARQVSQRCPGTGVVILTMHNNEGYVAEALRNGARAYVLKESSSENLVEAIRVVMSGHCYLSAPLSERAIDVYTRKSEVSTVDPYDRLTTREREVLQLAGAGHTNADIAERLFISPRTVETHRTNLMRKLGLHTQTQLIRYAMQRGVIAQEST